MLEHRRPKLCGSSLDFEFTLCFCFVFYCLFASRAVPCQNLILNVDKTASKRQQKHKVSHFYFYFCPKMEFRTYFVYFQTFSYKFKSIELPQSLGCLWLAKSVEDQKRVHLSLK